MLAQQIQQRTRCSLKENQQPWNKQVFPSQILLGDTKEAVLLKIISISSFSLNMHRMHVELWNTQGPAVVRQPVQSREMTWVCRAHYCLFDSSWQFNFSPVFGWYYSIRASIIWGCNTPDAANAYFQDLCGRGRPTPSLISQLPNLMHLSGLLPELHLL